MASRSPEQKLMDRMRHLPVATENTVKKLEALLAEHEAYRMPIDESVQAKFDELRSRFLTDTTLIDAHWNEVIDDARRFNRR